MFKQSHICIVNIDDNVHVVHVHAACTVLMQNNKQYKNILFQLINPHQNSSFVNAQKNYFMGICTKMRVLFCMCTIRY